MSLLAVVPLYQRLLLRSDTKKIALLGVTYA